MSTSHLVVILTWFLLSSAAETTLGLFLDPEADVHDRWGLLTVAGHPVDAHPTLRPPPLEPPEQAVIAAYPVEGGFELFASSNPNNTGASLLRFTSSDLIHWSEPEEVLCVAPDDGGRVSLKTMARRPAGQGRTALYSLLAFGYNKSLAEHFNVAYAWTSINGRAWQPAVAGTEHPFVFADHDDSMTIWDESSARFVDIQVTYEPVASKTVFGHGVADQIGDNVCQPGGRCVRRVLSARTSGDGRVWSADVEPYRTPDADDPPELEFYRARPFRAAGRYFASVLLYAPSPSYVTGLLPPMCRKDCATCCHASHMYSELWTLLEGANPADLHAWQRPWRWSSMRTASGPWTPTDVLLDAEPLEVADELVWLQAAAAYYRPSERLGGLTSPANAAFSSRPFAWPASGRLWLNANVSFWNQTTPGAIQPAAHCDQGCQAFVLAELRDAQSGAVIDGYAKEGCLLRNIDGRRLPLRWTNATTASTPRPGQSVRLRLYMRAAVIYSFGFS